MRWELRLRAAERGVFKAVEMRRLLAQAGLPVSAGKMSALWSTTVAPVSIRLDDLEILCRVLRCDPAALLVPEQPPDPPSGAWITTTDPPGTGSGAHAGWAGSGGEAGPGPRPVRPKLPPL